MGEGGARALQTRSLVGRTVDIAVVRSFVDDAGVEGGALLLWGDAGVGKTVLLDAAAAYAAQVGTRVVRAAGAEFEADVSFAALNQLLQPLLGGPHRLSALHARALGVALGLADGPAADRLVTSNAALNLLLQASASQPVLVIVDDVPWLDRASAVVLGFVARRLAGSRVGLLAASRTGEESFLGQDAVPGHEVKPLDDVSAVALLEERFPAMAPRVRQRLMAEAQGNPLALLELPAALSIPQREAVGALPVVLPLGRRLQAMFASRVENLPAPTREVLLLAALDGTGDLDVLVAGPSDRPTIDDLAPAERARLVQIEPGAGRLAFAHPLIRSAVVEQSTSDQRRRAHRALAERRVDQPQRRVWHLAEAAVGPDEEVAALLNWAAHESARRGDAVGAISELLRAAQLSPAGSDRSNRLSKAAYLGATVTGDLRSMPRLLDAAREADADRVGSLAGAIAAAYYLLHGNGNGDVDTAHGLLVEAIERFADPTDAHHQPLIEALYNLLLVCVFGGRAELWEPFDAATSRLAPQPPELLTILSGTLSDPARLALPVLARLDAAVSGLSQETSPARIVRTAIAAVYVDRLPDCRGPLWRVVDNGRGGGAITSAIEALFLLSIDAFVAGQWDQLLQFTNEGLELCESHSYRLLSCPGQFVRALVAAARGQDEEVRVLTDEMGGWAAPRRVRSVVNYVCHARALLALSNGDFEGAYRNAAAVSPAGALASHVPHALWLMLELTEAAVRTGRRTEAMAHVAAARDADIASISPRLAFITAAAAALVAPEDQCDEWFEEALAIPGPDRWPFELARVHLAYGERLRRAKATAQAREHLTAARTTFDGLAARPWAARAGSELRATGLTVGSPDRAGIASLSPQQLEIARLAASGLTNKQIAEKLFLSPRTIGTHLYQLFPKLGVTSRAALRDALKDMAIDP